MADSGWLPEILRTPGIQTEVAGAPVGAEGSEVTGADAAGVDGAEALPAFLGGAEDAVEAADAEALPAFLAEDGDEPRSEDEVIEAYRIAAE